MAGEWNGNGLHGTVKDAEIENQVREKFHQCGKYTQRLQTKKWKKKFFVEPLDAVVFKGQLQTSRTPGLLFHRFREP